MTAGRRAIAGSAYPRECAGFRGYGAGTWIQSMAWKPRLNA